jgi:hypothetical protein
MACPRRDHDPARSLSLPERLLDLLLRMAMPRHVLTVYNRLLAVDNIPPFLMLLHVSCMAK